MPRKTFYLPLLTHRWRRPAHNKDLVASSEHTPLLDGPAANGHTSYGHQLRAFIAAEGQPSWLKSYRFLLFGSWLNILLVFVPLSVIAHNLNWDAGLRFGFSFVAIIPLAKVGNIPYSLQIARLITLYSSLETRQSSSRSNVVKH